MVYVRCCMESFLWGLSCMGYCWTAHVVIYLVMGSSFDGHDLQEAYEEMAKAYNRMGDKYRAELAAGE